MIFIAEYFTGHEYGRAELVFTEDDKTTLKEAWELARANEGKFINGYLVKIKILPQ